MKMKEKDKYSRTPDSVILIDIRLPYIMPFSIPFFRVFGHYGAIKEIGIVVSRRVLSSINLVIFPQKWLIEEHLKDCSRSAILLKTYVLSIR